MFKQLLTSKRVWLIVITASLHVLAKYHIVLTDADASAIADQIVLAAGALLIVGTKVVDAKKCC